MGNVNTKSIPWYFLLLIVLYVYHSTLPVFGYYTPAAVHIFATLFLYVLLMVHDKQFLNNVGKVLPIFIINILSILYFGMSHVAIETYGLLQLFLYPLLALYLIRTADRVVLKRIVFWVLLSYVVTSVTTFWGCIRFPQAARDLATGMSDDQELLSLYLQNNIGSFIFIYSLVLLLPTVICALRNRKIPVLIGLLLVVVMSFTIVQSEYSTALLLLLLSLMLFFAPKQFKSKQLGFIIIIFILVLLVLRNLLPNMFTWLGEQFESELIQARMEELSNFSIIDDKYEGDIGSRYERILLDLESFARSPLWGSTSAVTGGHSYFFDNLARFGLVGLLGIFIMFRQLFKLFYKPFKTEKIYGFAIFVLVIAFIMMILNPKDYISILTFIIPLSFTLYSENTENELL